MHSVVANDVVSNTASMIPPQRTSPEQLEQSFAGIISDCPRMRSVFAIIKKIARTDSTALILGETGTGKELVARAIHSMSGRRGNLIPVNCGAIPEDILESELFGHERGAFTGAVNNRIGRFQLADGGTIFLDEIGEMSPKLQVKLLRVLQERKVEPVGSTKSIDVNVRIIAATNKDLREEVKAGRFREDLYYRLQVIPIMLPPLRERGGDVMLLSKYFLSRTSESFGISPFTLSVEATEALRRHTWPGNVRELENVMERVAVLAESDLIQLADLPEHIRCGDTECEIIEAFCEMPDDGLDFNELVSQFENKLILMALGQTNGNKKAAAELLRLNRTTLVEKIKKKGLEWSSSMASAADPLFA